METVITAKGAGLGAWVDEDFANCRQIVVVHDDGTFDAYPNPITGKNQGKKLADFILSTVQPLDCLVTSHIDTDALASLSRAGIRVYSAQKGSVLELVEEVKKQRLPLAGM
jgi:predicted Fe-Mo cluster-binding NifX family protein